MPVAAAGAATASAFPWGSVAMAGSSILEAIINKLFFGPPKGVRGLAKDVARKGRELIAKPGYSEEAIRAIFGKNFENIRGQGKNLRQGQTEAYGRAGMLGTGSELAAGRKSAWQNENLVTEAMRDLLITGEAKKSSDIQLATQMLGAASGAGAQMQGEGPAITEMLINAMLMNQNKKKAALSDNDWAELFDSYGAAKARGTFGSYNFGAPIPGNPDALWYG